MSALDTHRIRAGQFRRSRENDFAGGRRSRWTAKWPYRPAAEYQVYRGPEDLIRWFEWYGSYPHWLPNALTRPLAALSEQPNARIISALESGTYRFSHIDEYNASDYLFQNLYPIPERMKISRILDFGPGFGRQVNLWSQLNPALVYVGLEGIELPYCIQNYYYSQFNLPLHEYLDDPDKFTVAMEPGIYHLPTWQSDLLPPNFFDLVICVQVLQEIPEELVHHIIEVFARVLKPGGALYIRDHGMQTPRVHTVDMDSVLGQHEFVLEFRPYVVDTQHSRLEGHDFAPDVHGIPRIWRKRDSRYPAHALTGAGRNPWVAARKAAIRVDAALGGLGRSTYQVLRRHVTTR
jgi:SAM-dependent methyltransferase